MQFADSASPTLAIVIGVIAVIAGVIFAFSGRSQDGQFLGNGEFVLYVDEGNQTFVPLEKAAG